MRSIFLLSLVSFGVSAGFNSGNYPSFAWSSFAPGKNITNTSNIISHAIENRHTVTLNSQREFNSALKPVFAEAYANDSYLAQKLESPGLLSATREVISDFVCEEYRFRHRQPEAEGCDGLVRDDRQKQPMPFISGRAFEQGIQKHRDDRKNGVSFTVRLAAAADVPLSHTYGAVHELGSFFGGLADSDSLILSLRMKAYQLSDSGNRQQAIYPNELIYFVILPTAREMARQGSAKQAASYALQQAKLLVVDSRK